MSSRSRTTTSTTGSARTLRSVPEQTVAAKVRTDTEDKLWEALHANPNSATTDLSGAAKIGKSTAQKILVKWAGDGSVTRTAGIAEGGRRAADLWAITEVDTTPADPPPVDTTAAEDADTHAEPVAPDATDADDSAVTEEDPVEQTETAADGAQDPADAAEAAPVEAKPVVAEVSDPTAANGADGADGATTDGDTTTEVGADATGEKKARLAPGGLRGMVEDYLRDHPGEQFGPTAIANALGGKSSGAVSNALDKLVEGGVAAKTQDKPRRFALASAEQEAAPAPPN
jgi:hypothetical protein